MQRLIDAEDTKLMLSELLEVANKEKFSAEDAINHAYEWIDRLPTTTEAEIRAKVLQEAISKILPYGSLAAEWNDSMSKEEIAQEVIDQAKECFIDILEQLKEE